MNPLDRFPIIRDHPYTNLRGRKCIDLGYVRLKLKEPIDPRKEELKLYFRNICETCIGSSSEERSTAIRTIVTHSEREVMVPVVIKFIKHTFKFNRVFDLNLCLYLLHIINAIIYNSEAFKDFYSFRREVTSIIPVVKKYILHQDSFKHEDNKLIKLSLRVRCYASKILAKLFNMYVPEDDYRKSSLLRKLQFCFSTHNSIATMFGAIRIFAAFEKADILTYLLCYTRRICDLIDSPRFRYRAVDINYGQTVKQLLFNTIYYVLHSEIVENNIPYPTRNNLCDFKEEFGSIGEPLFNRLRSNLKRIKDKKTNIVNIVSLENPNGPTNGPFDILEKL